MDGEGEQEQAPPKNRGQIIVTFEEDDSLSVRYNDMKPWKFWAAGKMLETLGDQMAIQAQMEQMQQQQQMQALLGRQGGLRGPRQ
jgi:hypothetical protein